MVLFIQGALLQSYENSLLFFSSSDADDPEVLLI